MADVESTDLTWESDEVEHSRLGASGAHRWMNCPGSVALTNSLGSGARQAGRAAKEGTATHTLASMCLEQGKEPYEFMGTKIDDFPVDSNMASAVGAYISYHNEVTKGFKGKVYETHVEHPLQSELDADAFGTADCIVYMPGEFIHVIDYKHGIGVIVEPDCTQTKYYGSIAYEKRPDIMRGDGEPKQIIMTIVQPRAMHSDGPIRSYTTVPKALDKWFRDEVLPAMAATRDPDAELHIGDWCRWCGARDACPALKKEVFEFDSTGVDPTYLTGEEIGDLMSRCQAISAYHESLKKEAYERAMLGNKIKGFKLVNKQANRAWKDGADKVLVKRFGDGAYEPRKVRSPAQVESKLENGKDFVAEWAFKPTTGFTLAPEGDKRQEVSVRVEYFADLPSDLAD